jgi:hypothetical protein
LENDKDRRALMENQGIQSKERRKNMKHKKSNLLFFRLALVLFVIGLIAGIGGFVHAADSSATITTDKTKYSLGETMIISGSGFTPEGAVTIMVQLPGNNGVYTLEPVTTDVTGTFQTPFYPPMIPGRYKITATDGIDTAKTAATEADAENEDFYGWRMSDRTPGYPDWPGQWDKGNLQKEWREGDWVSYVFVLNGYGEAPLPSGFKIRYDTLQASSGAILVDLVRNFSYKIRAPYSGSGYPTDVTPANFETWRDGTWVPSEVNVPCDNAGNPITNDEAAPGDFAYFTLDSSAFGTIPTGQSLVIYFELHLARTFVWSNGLESGYNSAPYNAWGGTRYATWTTDAWVGSGFVSGSSGHANEIGGGAKTVPIPIPPQPEGVIDGYKFSDLDNDGLPREGGEPGIEGWRIYIVGQDPDGLLLTGSVLTDSTGFYSIPNLTAGTW